MKKKKGTIAIIAILLIVALAVGYAVTSIDLSITGSAAANADSSNNNFIVEFTNAEYTTPTYSGSTAPTVSNVNCSGTSATFGVSGMTAINDTVTFTYTVENKSADLSAAIGNLTVTQENSTYFTVTTTGGNVTLAAGDTTTITVTVTCAKTPLSAQTDSITVSFTADPVEA